MIIVATMCVSNGQVAEHFVSVRFLASLKIQQMLEVLSWAGVLLYLIINRSPPLWQIRQEKPGWKTVREREREREPGYLNLPSDLTELSVREILEPIAQLSSPPWSCLVTSWQWGIFSARGSRLEEGSGPVVWCVVLCGHTQYIVMQSTQPPYLRIFTHCLYCLYYSLPIILNT